MLGIQINIKSDLSKAYSFIITFKHTFLQINGNKRLKQNL